MIDFGQPLLAESRYVSIQPDRARTAHGGAVQYQPQSRSTSFVQQVQADGTFCVHYLVNIAALSAPQTDCDAYGRQCTTSDGILVPRVAQAAAEMYTNVVVGLVWLGRSHTTESDSSRRPDPHAR